MDGRTELEYIVDYARGADLSSELQRDQLRCLWTAYCFHQNLDVDTSSYDTDIRVIWNVVSDFGDHEDGADWSDFDGFDNFMCRYLV